MIGWSCSKCGETLEAPESARGEKVACPKCRHVARVPTEPAETQRHADVEPGGKGSGPPGDLSALLEKAEKALGFSPVGTGAFRIATVLLLGGLLLRLCLPLEVRVVHVAPVVRTSVTTATPLDVAVTNRSWSAIPVEVDWPTSLDVEVIRPVEIEGTVPVEIGGLVPEFDVNIVNQPTDVNVLADFSRD